MQLEGMIRANLTGLREVLTALLNSSEVVNPVKDCEEVVYKQEVYIMCRNSMTHQMGRTRTTSKAPHKLTLYAYSQIELPGPCKTA